MEDEAGVATFARRWANCLGATDGGDIGAARLPKSPEVFAVCGRGFGLPTFWRTWRRAAHQRSGASQLPASRTPNPTRTRPNAARITRALATPQASTSVRPFGVSTSSQSRFQNSAAPIRAEPIPKMSDSLGIAGFYRVGEQSAIGGQQSVRMPCSGRLNTLPCVSIHVVGTGSPAPSPHWRHGPLGGT